MQKETVTIEISKWKYSFALILWLFLFAGSILMILYPRRGNPRDAWFGLLGAIFFGTRFVLTLFKLIRPKPRLTLDQDGIHSIYLKVGRIPWDEISDAYVRSVIFTNYLALELREAEVWGKKLGIWPRIAIPFQRTFGLKEFNISLAGIRGSAKRVLALVRERIGKSSSA